MEIAGGLLRYSGISFKISNETLSLKTKTFDVVTEI